jgi:hypothetical protein
MRPVRIRSIARHHPELDLRLAEAGRVGRNDEIADHGQLAAAAQRIAGNGGNHRLSQIGDPLPVGEEVVHIGRGIGLVLHLLDVGAGREGLLIAGHHHGADRRVGIEGLERGRKLGNDARAQRVENRRAVQRQQAHRIAAFDNDGFVGHA